jgi:membrane protease YdiL (CAAX protease family)
MEPPPSVRWRGTLLYPTALVAIFLGGQWLLALVGVPGTQQAPVAALPAVAALLLTLPRRLRQAWGAEKPWRQLGLRAPVREAARALLGGLGKALLLLMGVLSALALAGAVAWQPRLTPMLLLNGLLLGLGVGVAEELLFRGWLLGELGLQLGERRALLVQALVFSLVHTRFNLPLPLLLGLLGGLMLLGLALGLQRKADGGLLWGAIGVHGGLVGGWFLLQQLVELSSSAPALLMGPANPIGGLAGWLGLAWLVMAMRNPPGFRSRINQIPKN